MEMYREDGTLSFRWNYTNGNLNGITENYYGDGDVVRVNYKDGVTLGQCFEPGCTDFD